MKLFNKVAVAAGILVAGAGSAFAADPAAGKVDFTPITSAFTAGDILVGVMAICGVLALIYGGAKGGRIMLNFLQGR